jgi:Kdo2-lipid IVA lauroyltransferase/acyltransferase
VFSYPLPDGRLRVSYRPAIRPARAGTLQEDILLLTRACTALLEDEVRRRPDCWLWMHDRWRTRPPAQAPGHPHLAERTA